MNSLLSMVAGLKPLDRVQIISSECLHKQTVDRTLYQVQNPELPYAFFQRIMPDGTLALAGPSGASFRVSPEDVCDVVPGKRLEVFAMRDTIFKKSLALAPSERNAISKDWYEPALLTSVELDRWGRVDRATVQFLQGDPSDGSQTIGVYRVLHPESRLLAKAFAKRSNLPVVKNGSYATYASANGGVEAEDRKRKRLFRMMVLMSSQGNRHGIKKIAQCDI